MICPPGGRTFDRVVSVGMVEHVGRDNYRLFVDCAARVLAPGGLFLLHFISSLKELGGSLDQEIYFPRRRGAEPAGAALLRGGG